VRDKAEAESTFAPGGNMLGEFVERNQEIRPTMAGSQNIPRTENGRIQPASFELPFTFTANSDVFAHYRCGVSDADVYEMADAGNPRAL